MWSNIFIRLIRRKLVLGLILAFSALYCIVSFWQEVRTLPEHHFEVQHSMFYLLNNKVPTQNGMFLLCNIQCNIQ